MTVPTLTTGDQLLTELRNYVHTFPCTCSDDHLREDDGKCLVCRAEDMIEALEPPRPSTRALSGVLTFYGDGGVPLRTITIVSTASLRWDFDVTTKVRGISLEWR